MLEVLGVGIRHSREYNPPTNRKTENRIKEISRKLATELKSDVRDAKEEDIRKALISALAIMNFNVSKTSTFRSYEVRTVVNVRVLVRTESNAYGQPKNLTGPHTTHRYLLATLRLKLH